MINALYIRIFDENERMELAKEGNRHFLENDYGDLSFFSVVLN